MHPLILITSQLSYNILLIYIHRKWQLHSTLERPMPSSLFECVTCTIAGPSGRSPAEIVSSNPTGDMDVCCECCVLSGIGLCDELITRPEKSYRLWCVVVCDLETPRMRRS
jgi:hypothetical protein